MKLITSILLLPVALISGVIALIVPSIVGIKNKITGKTNHIAAFPKSDKDE